MLGWLGVICLLVAYGTRWRTCPRTDAVLNMMGTLLLVVACWDTAPASVLTLQVVWLGISGWHYVEAH